ncbi:MAG: hypothetical protein V4450_02625 [Bacteroidota bacterium]
MKLQRRLSVVLMLISAFVGLARGFRMVYFPNESSLLFSYSPEAIRETVFSNYIIFGWIIFSLVGVFGVITLAAVLRRTRTYGYLMMIEGIFTSFFSLTHIVYNGFGWIHCIVLPICFTTIILGVLQTPREF